MFQIKQKMKVRVIKAQGARAREQVQQTEQSYKTELEKVSYPASP